MPRVRPVQIAQIGKFIRFNLTTKKYTHDRWKRELFTEEDFVVSTKVQKWMDEHQDWKTPEEIGRE